MVIYQKFRLYPFASVSMTWGGGKGYIQSTSEYQRKHKMGKLHFEAKVSSEFLFGLSDNGRRALTIHIPKDLIMTYFVT